MILYKRENLIIRPNETDMEQGFIHMINLNRTQQVADIIHETILYSGIEGAIISTPIFNRLHHVLQSSLVYLTFSSNKVKRFEHSLGTMHLAGEMFYYSICNSSDIDKLMDKTKECISQWYSEKDFMRESSIKIHYLDKFNKNNFIKAPIPKCSIYNMYFPHNISHENAFMYFLLFQSVRIAGLLHDIGHLPYSHIFEHAAQ